MGDALEDGPVGGIARADAAVVLAKGHIHDPVVGVFTPRGYPPVLVHRLQQGFDLGGQAAMKKRVSVVTRSPQRCSDSTGDGGIGLSMRGSPQAESGTAHGSHMATHPVSTPNLDAIALRGHEPALPAA